MATLHEKGAFFIDHYDGSRSVAASMDYLLEYQVIPQLNGSHDLYSINWHLKDDFNKALKTIETNTANEIQRSPHLRELLKKESWTKSDREDWEENINRIVTKETAKIPGFAHYRTLPKHGGYGIQDRIEGLWSYDNINEFTAKNVYQLNELSSDIKNNTEKLRFDCGIESIVKGAVLQRLENDHGFLPQTATSPNDYKRIGDYYYVTGGVTFRKGSQGVGNHASIYTPVGNIIEATANNPSQNGYVRSLYADTTLEGILRGKPFIAQNGSVYDQTQHARGTSTQPIRDAVAETHKPNRDDGKILSHSELEARAKSNGTVLTEAPDDGVILLATKATKDGKDVYEIKAFQKQMIGLPQEGYVLVGYKTASQAMGTQPPNLSTEYRDLVDYRTYKFNALFGETTVKSSITVPSHGQQHIDVNATHTGTEAPYVHQAPATLSFPATNLPYANMKIKHSDMAIKDTVAPQDSKKSAHVDHKKSMSAQHRHHPSQP